MQPHSLVTMKAIELNCLLLQHVVTPETKKRVCSQPRAIHTWLQYRHSDTGAQLERTVFLLLWLVWVGGLAGRLAEGPGAVRGHVGRDVAWGHSVIHIVPSIQPWLLALILGHGRRSVASTGI